jgi:hypothetical protein
MLSDHHLPFPWRMPSSGMWRCVDLVWTTVHPKRRFTQDLHKATSQKTAFFIGTAVKTSNLTSHFPVYLIICILIFCHCLLFLISIPSFALIFLNVYSKSRPSKSLFLHTSTCGRRLPLYYIWTNPPLIDPLLIVLPNLFNLQIPICHHNWSPSFEVVLPRDNWL